MHFSNSDTGMISALPLIIQFGAKWLTGEKIFLPKSEFLK